MKHIYGPITDAHKHFRSSEVGVFLMLGAMGMDLRLLVNVGPHMLMNSKKGDNLDSH